MRGCEFDKHSRYCAVLVKCNSNNKMPRLPSDKFSCLFCGRPQVSKWHVDNHIRSHLNEKPYFCNQCKQCHYSRQKLKMHQATHLLNRSRFFTCTTCGKCFFTSCALYRHNKTVHPNIPRFKCQNCPKCFKTQNTLSLHIRNVHNQERSHSCSLCDKKYFYKGDLSRHLQCYLDEKAFVCDTCNYRLNTKSLLDGHRKTHAAVKDSRVSHLRQKIQNRETLKIHLKRHGEGEYNCNICGKQFKVNGDFVFHILVHTGERLYKCKLCPSTFCRSNSMRSHMNSIHIQDPEQSKPVHCAMCLKRFSSKTHLEVHMAIHTMERPYECSICLKTFAQNTALRGHVKLHSEVKHHTCELCPRQFNGLHELKVHMTAHTGGKHHGCKVSPRRFRGLACLRFHMELHHNKSTSYNYAICCKSFKTRSYLSIHVHEHHKMKRFHCIFCVGNKGYLTETHFFNHIRRHVNETTGSSLTHG